MMPDLVCNEAGTKNIRKNLIKMLHSLGGGHYGGGLSVVDILYVLYTEILSPKNNFFDSVIRDRLILSKGHTASALYCMLAELNQIEESKLHTFGNFMSGLEGHPDMLVTKGIDFSTGSLGQGLSAGLGMAIGLRKTDSHVWVILGDGECQEGQVWEAAMLASRYKVKNLHAIVDANGAQEYGYKYNSALEQLPVPKLCEKWKSFGWRVLEVDGHDTEELKSAFNAIKNESDLPSIIIARTKKGFGISQFEDNPESSHWTTLTEAEFQQALQELEQ